MPIYSGMPLQAERFTYQNFISLDRIPCASVLLRVDYSSIDYDGNFISIKNPDPSIAKLAYEEPPKYSEAAYATTYFLTSNVEREMFKKKAVNSTDAPLSDVLEAIIEVQGAHVESHAIINYFVDMMPTQDPSSLQVIDLTFLSSYDKNFGFRLCLDQITGLTESGKIY